MSSFKWHPDYILGDIHFVTYSFSLIPSGHHVIVSKDTRQVYDIPQISVAMFSLPSLPVHSCVLSFPAFLFLQYLYSVSILQFLEQTVVDLLMMNIFVRILHYFPIKLFYIIQEAFKIFLYILVPESGRVLVHFWVKLSVFEVKSSIHKVKVTSLFLESLQCLQVKTCSDVY